MFFSKYGIHTNDFKYLSNDKSIIKIKPSKILSFPLKQHIGKNAECIVNVGDRVLSGQIIAKCSDDMSSNILSSVSGTVLKIDDIIDIYGNRVKSIIVENDEKYEYIDNYGIDIDYEKKSADEIINIVKEAGIVGLGGAAFPTHIKLNPKDKDSIKYLIINGVECEPYLTSDYKQMIEETDMLIKGINCILKIFTSAKVYICIEDNKIDAYKKINVYLKENNVNNIELVLLKTKYPQGGERQLIYSITGEKFDFNELPKKVGCLVQNVSTVISIAYAVCKNMPFIGKTITITGDAVNEPVNAYILFGSNYEDIINEIGGFKCNPKKIIVGGPMMGVSIYNLNSPFTKNSSSIIALKDDILENIQETNCINCGKCINVCPMSLLPTKLYKVAKKNDYKSFINLNGQSCIKCGCCSYICPAKKPLTAYFSFMKLYLENNLNNINKENK